MSRGRLAVVLLVAAAAAAFFAVGGHRYLSLENLKAQQAALEQWRAAHPVEPIEVAASLKTYTRSSDAISVCRWSFSTTR